MLLPPHTIQEVEDLILKEFDLLWGIAPPDSLKGKKGADIKDFLRSQIDKIAAQAISAVVPEEESSINPKTGMKYYHPENKGMVRGHNNCRQEVLRRSKEFLGE